MKYIRIKDGIYEYILDYQHRYADLIMNNAVCKSKQEFNKRQKKRLRSIYYSKKYKTLYVYSYGGFYMLNVIKQANSIEELIDEFIVENPEKDIHEKCCDLQDVFDWVDDQEIPIGIKHFDEERNLISGKHDWKVYGAIWTDKGLIYVAKMNKEGELELL